MKLELLKQARENERRIKFLEKQIENSERIYLNKKRKIERRCANLREKLIRQEEREKKPLKNERDKIKTKLIEEIESLYIIIPKRDRILKFFKIVEYKEFIKDNPRGLIIDTIRDDKYCKIVVNIDTNGKPKNEYSLYLVGYSLFNEDFGKEFNRFPRYSKNLLDKPTEEELKGYWNRNKEKIIKSINEEINKLIIEYEEAEKLYEIKEWKIAYLENKLNYYTNHYSHGEETQGYKDIISKLVEITHKPKYKKMLKEFLLKGLNNEDE